MRTLYFDCFAGASGNMILGGLIALGVSRDGLADRLKGLKLHGFDLVVTHKDRSGINGVHVQVNVPSETKHRHLHNIEKIIDEASLSEGVKQRSKAIFRRLADAEAKVHCIGIDKVHFHEVGAMDAIVDVVGACIGFELLGIDRFACSKIHVGSGFVDMDHGKYPVPPPAVAELLAGMPIYSTEIHGELITPTGAAIIATLCSSYGQLPEMIVERTGYGAGTRKYEGFPNVLRMMIGETGGVVAKGNESLKSGETISEKLTLLETNLDDISPQVLGFVLDKAFEIGALDAWFTPIQMKKNRPAVSVSLLCSGDLRNSISEMLYRETTTLGIRTTEIERNSLPREEVEVETRFGKISVKTARFRGKVVNAMPEFEQVRRAAVESGIPFRKVHAEVLSVYEKSNNEIQISSKTA